MDQTAPNTKEETKKDVKELVEKGKTLTAEESNSYNFIMM